jgi:hypothetical protein
MNPWFELLFILSVFVCFFSGVGLSYLDKTYGGVLEGKFPSHSEDLSTHKYWQGPIEKIKRWKMATRLGDDKLAIVAKRCYLLMYIILAATIFLFLLILTHI